MRRKYQIPPANVNRMIKTDDHKADGSTGVSKRAHLHPSMIPVSGFKLNAQRYCSGTKEELYAIGLKNIPMRNIKGRICPKSLNRMVSAATQTPNAIPASIVNTVKGIIARTCHPIGIW
jgi:hypothetical protein